MYAAKFIVGVLTIAIGLLAAGKLAPAVVGVAKLAVQGQKDHQDFSLGSWNRKLGN